MKFVKRKLILILCFTLIFSMLIGGCGKQQASSGSGISATIKVSLAGWTLEDGMNPVTGKKTIGLTEYLKSTFNKQYPNIKLEISQVPWETYIVKQKALLQSNDVDILSAGGAEAIFYNEGLLRDIEDLLKSDSSFKPEELYPKGLWDSSTHVISPDGKHFALPETLGRRIIIYDKKLFDDWGVQYLSEKPTPDEILQKAKKMTGKNPKTGEQNYGLWFDGKSYDSPTFRALTYYYNAPGAEGKLTDPKNLKWQINTPSMVKVMEWLGEAAKYINPAFVNSQGNENFGKANNVNAIMLEAGGQEIMDEVTATGKKDMLDRFIPTMHFGPKGEGYVAVDSIIMAKNPSNLEAAWIVMKFFASYEMQKYLYENYMWAPALKKADFIDPNDKYLKTALKVADNAHADMLGDDNPFFISDMVPVINGFISQANLGKSADINKLLTDLQEKAQKWSTSIK